jgi:hypothetical protein
MLTVLSTLLRPLMYNMYKGRQQPHICLQEEEEEEDDEDEPSITVLEASNESQPLFLLKSLLQCLEVPFFNCSSGLTFVDTAMVYYERPWQITIKT